MRNTAHSGRIEELARQVIEKAGARGVTLATTESCTGGAIAMHLAEAPGAAKQFHGGIVVYTKNMKSKLLGVSPRLLAECTAVCTEVAIEMARSPADVAVSITGVASPEPDEDGNPVGLIYCASVDRGGEVESMRLNCGDAARDTIPEQGIRAALELLLRACDRQTGRSAAA